MRGLKRDFCYTFVLFEQSHLLQMRGLKHNTSVYNERFDTSHLLQMRGLKQTCKDFNIIFAVSHLLQMRGLKPYIINLIVKCTKVASFTDAWIETLQTEIQLGCISVASFTDAWIETTAKRQTREQPLSHLLQMRGLKHYYLDDLQKVDTSHLLQMRGLKLGNQSR